MHILGYSNDYKTCIRPCCFLNSFGSLVYSNTVAGSRSLGRTSRDPEVSRLPSCGRLYPLLLWESSWSFPPLQHRTWVVLSSAVSLKTLSPPVPSACCAGASPPSPVTPLQPGHSFPQAAAGTSPREWHQTARDWDAAASFLWSPGRVKAAALPGLVGPAHVGIAISAVLSKDVSLRPPTPTVAYLSEILYLWVKHYVYLSLWNMSVAFRIRFL